MRTFPHTLSLLHIHTPENLQNLWNRPSLTYNFHGGASDRRQDLER